MDFPFDVDAKFYRPKERQGHRILSVRVSGSDFDILREAASHLDAKPVALGPRSGTQRATARPITIWRSCPRVATISGGAGFRPEGAR